MPILTEPIGPVVGDGTSPTRETAFARICPRGAGAELAARELGV